VSADGALGFSDDAAQVFDKTVQDLRVGAPGVVTPAMFQYAYDPATDPAFKRSHARRVEGMPNRAITARFTVRVPSVKVPAGSIVCMIASFDDRQTRC
jgi:hypothetical protein